MNRLSLVSYLPHLLTTLGLCSGLTSIRFALTHQWHYAIGLVFVAVLFDGLDGRLARFLKQSSKLGVELDSLSDFVSFGIVPAFLVYYYTVGFKGYAGFTEKVFWLVIVIFCLCCAFRLARFNILSYEEEKPLGKYDELFFTGLSSPMAAGLMLLPMMLDLEGISLWDYWFFHIVWILFLGFLMISYFPTCSMKGVRLIKKQYMTVLLIGFAIVLVGFFLYPWKVLLMAQLGLLLSLPLWGYWYVYLHSEVFKGKTVIQAVVFLLFKRRHKES